MMRHDDAAELLGAYALDALEADESAEVEAHLAECPRCRDEVSQHREAAAALAFVGTAAPEGLWARISEHLETAPPLPDMARMYPLQRARDRRNRSVSLRLASAVASVAAVLVVLLGLEVNSQRQDLHNVKRVINTTSGLDRAVQAALVDPSSARVTLASNDGSEKVEAVVTSTGTGYLVSNNLPSLGAHRTYQLWGKVGNTTVSLGVIGPRFATVPFKANVPLDALALTDEQAPGVVSSQQKAVAFGLVDPAKAPSGTAT